MRKIAYLFLFAILAGCNSRPVTLDLQGEVSYAGKPVQRGKIHFMPTDNTPGHSAVTLITDGHYQLPTKWGLMPDGVYLVQIEGYRKTGRKVRHRNLPDGRLIDEIEEFIPAMHNRQSTLKIRVTDLPDKDHADFHLGKTSGAADSYPSRTFPLAQTICTVW